MESDEQERKLFVGGLNKTQTDEESLRQFFSGYGTIVDVSIMRDVEKQSRGFGFVLFESAIAVDDIISDKKAGKHFELNEHYIEVKRALPKVPGGNAGTSRTGGLYRKIFVGGLPSSIKAEDLRNHFQAFGAVGEIDLLRDRETNRLRGFAFVTFEDEDSADKCIQRPKQEICKKLCEVKRAQTRSNLTKYDEEQRQESSWRQDRDRYSNLNDRHRGGVSGPPSATPGMISMTEVNQLIQQAYIMGQQSIFQNTGAPTAASLLGLNNVNNYSQPTANNPLLQALIQQQTPPAATAHRPSPISAPASANANTLAQLAQLLNREGIDANTLTSALIKQEESSRGPPKNNGAGGSAYSTSYPNSSNYDMYYNPQISNYGPSKDDSSKRDVGNYRPY